MRDEALFQSSVSREILCSLLKCERVLDTLDETQDVHQHSRPHSRGTRSFPTHLNLSPLFPPHFEMRVDSPAFSGKELQSSFHTPRGGWSHIETLRKPRWSCHNPKDTDFPIHSSKGLMTLPRFECNPEYQVTTRRTTDTTLASSIKSRRFQIQLDKRPDTSLTTQEESRVQCLKTRRVLPPLFKLYRNLEMDVRNGEDP